MERQKKIGRNQLCWCGSGKKYKRCHLDREAQTPPSPWDAAGKVRAAFNKKICSAPSDWHKDCSRQITRAHTVPKSGSLNQIARNGHVYAFIPSIENLQKNNGVIVPELIGVNRASTFTGFCSNHDNSIFSPLEKVDFTGTKEQCFLLMFRSVAREFYTKQAAASLADIRKDSDKGKAFEQQLAIQEFNVLHDFGLAAGVKDGVHFKSLLDEMLQARDYATLHAYVIELTVPPDIMCSGSIFPEEDFDGNRLQDLNNIDDIPSLLSFTSFSSAGRGYIVFSWLDESEEICRRFINSLAAISNQDLANSLIRLFIEHCENVYLRPDWWEALPQNLKKAMIDRMAHSANPFMPRRRNFLIDDKMSYEVWPIAERTFV